MLALQVGLAVTYTVTAAESMQILEILHEEAEVRHPDIHPGLMKYVFIFAIFQVGLSQIPNIQHLWWVSIIGALMSLLYSLLSGILAITAAKSDNVAPDYAHRDSEAAFWRGVFTSLGAVTFTYGGHSVLLEI